MVLLVSCTCCALVRASAECCGYLCYPSVVMRHDPCDQTLCPYPWFSAHVLYPCSWDAMSSVTWYWLPNCGRSCNSHSDLIACIIGYLNSDLTLPLNRYHGPLWYFVRQGSPVLIFFSLDQTNWFFKLLDVYSSQRFCEQVHRVILPWDVTDRDSLVLYLFPYVMVTNVHMFDPRLLCWVRC